MLNKRGIRGTMELNDREYCGGIFSTQVYPSRGCYFDILLAMFY